MLTKEQDTKRLAYLDDFRKFRDIYLDDLPEGRLLPGCANYSLYKCRTNFFNTVSLRIMILIRKGVIPENSEIDSFFEYMESRNWHAFTTRKDIDVINDVIHKMIRILESPSETIKP